LISTDVRSLTLSLTLSRSLVWSFGRSVDRQAKLRLKFDDAFDDADEPVHQATTLLSVVPSSQTKTLYLIRHGEGYHNVGICNLDSRLTVSS